MSEEKEDHSMETQNSSYDDNLNDNTTMESDKLERVNSMNESQDFHLVDTSDDDSESKSQYDSVPIKQDKEPSYATLSDNQGELPHKKNIECKAFSDAECSDLPKQEDVQDAERVKKLEGKEEVDESASKTKDEDSEDDEVVQCTPPEHNETPSKKKSAENVMSLKRKAESFEEPTKKILRVEPEEDVLSTDHNEIPSKTKSAENVIMTLKYKEGSFEEPVKNILRTESKEDASEKIEEEKEDSYHSEDDTQPVFIKNTSDTNIIIAETQDDDIEIPIESPTMYEEKTKDEGQSEFENHETDKNKNFNDMAKLNDKEKSDPKNLTQSSENNELPVQTEETDSASPASPLKTVEETKSNLEQSDVQEVSISKDTNESNVYSANITKNRMSVEFIKAISKDEKEIRRPKELVEIDEEGEKIVLDSSQEDSLMKSDSDQRSFLEDTKNNTVYKTENTKSSSEINYKTFENTKISSTESAKSSSKLVNGSSESKKYDTDSTINVHSDASSDTPILDKTEHMNIFKSQETEIKNRQFLIRKELLSVSDNEAEHRSLSCTREVCMFVRVKYSVQVDEGSKEFLTKEITHVHCDPIMDPILRAKSHDTSASMADISGNDNKDNSPGSVNSNPQLFQLNQSRLSFASTASSLSSASSAASLATRLIFKENFSIPRPVKHAKKQIHDPHSLNDKQVDEMYERLTKEWQNSGLLTATVLNCLSTEYSGTDRDTYNVSQEKIEQLDQLQKIRSSTPEIEQDVVPKLQTSKSTRKGKGVKRPRSRNAKSADGQSNGLKSSKITQTSESNNSTPSKKKLKTAEQRNDAWSVINTSTEFGAQVQSQIVTDELIGKTVFAKWSDNIYYPGTIIEKSKNKYKVNFYDGQNKMIIESFLIPIPEVLKNGLSIYAAIENYDYGSCGIIIESEIVNNEIYYIVETDEGEKLRVQIQHISLSSDQAQLLKEEIDMSKALPTTPKHFAQVTLDNMVEGKRRSKRIATPNMSNNSTPNILKSKSAYTPSKSEPSVSGMSSKKKKMLSDSDFLYSDSNMSDKDDMLSIGVQAEIIGTPYEQTAKGPQSRIKSKSRSKKKPEDKDTIELLGPIPEPNSNLFKGMSFILTCASLETIDRFQFDRKDYSSDVGTEDEEEWSRTSFVRDRLNRQIRAGGGKVYSEFNDIPQEEYKITKLITNVPNTTAKMLQCLSVGIPVYSHKWIIRCCLEGKLVSLAENELPAGWSLEKDSYIEVFKRPNKKPLNGTFVIIPVIESHKHFASFWQQICENAGAVVLVAEKQDAMDNLLEGTTVVLTNSSCPSWAVQKANELKISLLSTTWVTQCLVEGKLCEYDAHPRYTYNYK